MAQIVSRFVLYPAFVIGERWIGCIWHAKRGETSQNDRLLEKDVLGRQQ